MLVFRYKETSNAYQQLQLCDSNFHQRPTAFSKQKNTSIRIPVVKQLFCLCNNWCPDIIPMKWNIEVDHSGKKYRFQDFLPCGSNCRGELYAPHILAVKYCLWKEILSQQRIRHFKILQSIYFACDVGIISSYSNRMWNTGYQNLDDVWFRQCEAMTAYLMLCVLIACATSKTRLQRLFLCRSFVTVGCMSLFSIT